VECVDVPGVVGGKLLRRRKILIALNTAWNLYNFRAGLIRSLVEAGYDVVAVAPPDEYAHRLLELGCRFVPFPMDNMGTNPARDLLLALRFFCLFMRERPDVYLGYTVKPNVYGSLMAHTLGIPVVNNIAGLGTAFIKQTWLTELVRRLYRLALSRSVKVFFQNESDRRLFVEGGLVRRETIDLVPGSGIDLLQFAPVTGRFWIGSSLAPPSNDGGKFRFLLIARMVWDKGIGEYVEAARRLREHFPYAEFFLLGFLDVQNPTAISRAQMDLWVAEGVVNYLGETDDVRPHLAAADCIVLPSYREGTPRTLLEAAAMARPIVTTDAVGCREVLDDGRNGFLCKPRDAGDLAAKMELMLLLTDEQRREMGLRGREKMEREFDEQIVIRKYLDTIAEIISRT